MENLDVVVLCTLHGWRAAGRRALLATVVRTWGSSPRPVGSIMALCEDGAVVGSVSGGCIEDDLIDRHTRAYAQAGAAADGADHRIPSGPPSFVKYGISADEAHRFGLPCGGTLELVLESMGYAILSPRAVSLIHQKRDLKAVPLQSPVLTNRLFLGTSMKYAQTRLQSELIRIVGEICSAHFPHTTGV